MYPVPDHPVTILSLIYILRFSWNLFFGVSGRHMASTVHILYNELAERLARERFYFLGELFIFGEGTLGWFSDATSCMNVMQVSASAACVFNMHPPTSVHFGDYPDVYLIKRPAQMQAMTRPGAAVDPRVHDLFQASKIVTICDGRRAEFWDTHWINGRRPSELWLVLWSHSTRRYLTMCVANTGNLCLRYVKG